MPLNDTLIRGLKAEARARKYSDGGGLFLFIPTNGSKLWRMAYRFEGKSKLLSFGDYPTLSLKDARERREAAKKLLAQGIDPSEHKREERKARLYAAGYDYWAVQRLVNGLAWGYDRVAWDVIHGKYGNDQARINALTAAGYDAYLVQDIVNGMLMN